VLVYQRREHASSVDPVPPCVSSNQISAGGDLSRSDADDEDELESNRENECGMDIN